MDVSKDIQLPHYSAMKRNYDIAQYRGGKRMGPAMPVDITRPWPQHQMSMDNTQMDALKTMLSNNIAVVQGKINKNNSNNNNNSNICTSSPIYT